MSENLLRIELYRILVSIAVGLITILVFIFNVSVAESSYFAHSPQVDTLSNISEIEKAKSTHKYMNWSYIKWSIKRTLKIFKENTVVFLVLSVFVGDFLSSLGLAVVTRFFQKPIDGGLYEREVYIDKNIEWRNFAIFLRTIDNEKHMLNLALSEVYFSLAKAYAGIFIGFYISYPILYYPLAKTFEHDLAYFVIAFIYLLFMSIFLFLLLPSGLKLRLYLIDKAEMIIQLLLFVFVYISFLLSVSWSTIIGETYTSILKGLFFNPLIIVLCLYILVMLILFPLSIHNMKLYNQLRCLASEECYKKQDTIQETTSQPSTNQSPPQSPPKHTQEHHTQN